LGSGSAEVIELMAGIIAVPRSLPVRTGNKKGKESTLPANFTI
jgi:hypothetical protein